MKVNVQSETISATIMYNVKSDRQASYVQNSWKKFNRHRYIPLYQISMGLLRRYFDRDNILLDVLSTPNYGLAIPSPQWLKWETAIAEVVVNNMKEIQRICNPTNHQKNV